MFFGNMLDKRVSSFIGGDDIRFIIDISRSAT